ncbi:prepilin-type N-terminal cleavage/methylation domain-containing protein [Candidatus Omnitrophota bacterium]
MHRNNFKAFTLIELLIVLTMVSIIGLAIFVTLSNGIDIWQRLNQAQAQDDINIFFERFARELRNTFAFSTINFSGGIDSVSFATFVVTPGSSLPQETGIGRKAYRFDKAGRKLIKEEMNFSQVSSGASGSAQELLTEIDFLQFSYYFYDQQSQEYLWLQEWQEDSLPLAVRIELEFYNGKHQQRIIRSIDIPLDQLAQS